MTECADSGAARFRESVAIVLCSGNAGSPLVSYLRSVHLGYYGREGHDAGLLPASGGRAGRQRRSTGFQLPIPMAPLVKDSSWFVVSSVVPAARITTSVRTGPMLCAIHVVTATVIALETMIVSTTLVW